MLGWGDWLDEHLPQGVGGIASCMVHILILCEG
jgi:hypothetical protein